TDKCTSVNYSKIWIGGSGTLSEYADFSIAEARIYNTAITESQVRGLYDTFWRSGRLGGAYREYWVDVPEDETVAEAKLGSLSQHAFLKQASAGQDIIYSLDCPS